MKKIIISQRIDILKNRDETKDSIDQNLILFIQNLGCLPLVISNFNDNIDSITSEFLKLNKPHGILLSGGNDILQYPNRDEIEIILIKYAIKNKIPLIGICRGMQIINHYFKGSLKKVKNHVNIKHNIYNENGKEIFVNSYHNYAIKSLPKCLLSNFKCHDGTIESFKHRILPIYGIMWHPEREKKFINYDIELFKSVYKL